MYIFFQYTAHTERMARRIHTIGIKIKKFGKQDGSNSKAVNDAVAHRQRARCANVTARVLIPAGSRGQTNIFIILKKNRTANVYKALRVIISMISAVAQR